MEEVETPEDGRTLPWRVLDRAVRPYSLAVSLATAVITVSILTDSAVGVFLDGLSGHIIGAAAATTTALLWIGWWRRNTACMTQGLLLSSAVWTAIAVALTLDHYSWTSAALAYCWALASAGSWLLEVNDPGGRSVRA